MTIIIANQTDDTRTVTVQTAADAAGIRQSTTPINPQGTATLKLDLEEGNYTFSVDGGGIDDAAVKVGPARESSQDQLLQP